eukprot:SAG31_NODE_49_length_30599_cov_15.615016_34_plen_71_part_00
MLGGNLDRVRGAFHAHVGDTQAGRRRVLRLVRRPHSIPRRLSACAVLLMGELVLFMTDFSGGRTQYTRLV